MKLKLLAAAALLAVTGAQAQTTSVVGFSPSAGFYQSTYSFSLAGLSDLAGDIDFLGGTLGVSVTLFGSSGSVFDADAADGFSFSGLSSGSYQLAFTAFGTSGGAFGGSYTVSPSAIPELESYAMLLAGLGVVGFIAARRRQG